METLTREDQEALAELKNSRGYGVLLRLFEKELLLIQDMLMANTSVEQERHLVSRWREFKRVYNAMKTSPEYFAQELALAGIETMDEPYSPAFDQKVFETYRKKMFDEAIRPVVDVN